jgi:hypothetical protein
MHLTDTVKPYDDNLVWILSVNGMMVDIRDMPREAQVVAFEQG